LIDASTVAISGVRDPEARFEPAGAATAPGGGVTASGPEAVVAGRQPLEATVAINRKKATRYGISEW
jgi:hypothetical protein